MPERDIESLGVMGKGLEAARKFFHCRRRRRRRRRRPLPLPLIKSENPKSSYFFFRKSLRFCGYIVKHAKTSENQNLRSGPPDSADRSVSSS